MAIKVGDRIPNVTVKHFNGEKIEGIATQSLFEGKKVVLFSVPGAFTPTCSSKHLPGYVAKADDIKKKGANEIVCLSVNDPHVMRAWAKDQNALGKIFMLSDGNAAFTKALGLEQDLTDADMGVRGKRFMLIAENGVVTELDVETEKGVNVSGAEQCLAAL